MKTKIIGMVLVIGLIVAGIFKVLAKDETDPFLVKWNQAGVKKLEEMQKKDLATRLLQEAEQARIEKEKLLGITQDGSGKLSQ